MEQIVSCLIIDKHEYILSILSNIFLSDLKYNSNTLNCFTYTVKNANHNISFDTYQNIDILDSVNMLEKPYSVILIDSELVEEKDLLSFIETFSLRYRDSYLVLFYQNKEHSTIQSLLKDNKMITNIFLIEKNLEILPQKNLLYVLFEKIKFQESLQSRIKKEDDLVQKKTDELKKIIHSLILSRENLKKEIFNEKKTEKMLEDELKLLKVASKYLDNAIVVTDEQGFIYFSNQSLEKMLELTRPVDPNTHIDDLILLFNNEGKRINVSDYILEESFESLIDIEMIISGENIPAKKVFVTINKELNNEREIIGMSLVLKDVNSLKAQVSQDVNKELFESIREKNKDRKEVKVVSNELLIKNSFELLLSNLNYSYSIESRIESLNINENDIVIVDTDKEPNYLYLKFDVRYVLCTSDEFLQKNYDKYGFTSVLNKPFGLDDLRKLLDSLYLT